MKEHNILIDNKKCIGCSLCQKDCPVNNIEIKDNVATVKSQLCIKCGHCVAICPKNAVAITGFDELPTEIKNHTSLNPNQLLNAIKTRRTIRQFKNQTIAAEVINQIIEAGRWTPSGKNAQDVSYIVLSENLKSCENQAVRMFKRIIPIAKIFDAGIRDVQIDENFFFKMAPLAILVISKSEINASLAASNMELMAQSNGLGVLYSGFFSMAVNHSKKLRKLLKMKNKDKVVTTLVLGYPSVKYYRSAQKESAIVRYL